MDEAQRPSDRRSGSRWIDRFLVGVTALGLLATALRYGLMPVGGYDYWWHLATGREIYQTASLLWSEPFSYLAAGRPWTYKDAGAELLMFAVASVAGPAGIVIGKALAFLAFLGAVGIISVKTRRAPFWLVAMVMVVGIEASSFRISERPQTLALASTAVVLLILELHRAGRVSVFWCLPLVVLTANIHRGVWLLPPLLLLYAGCRLLTAFHESAETGQRALLDALHAERASLVVAVGG